MLILSLNKYEKKRKKRNALFAVITDHAAKCKTVKPKAPGRLCQKNSDNEMASFQLF